MLLLLNNSTQEGYPMLDAKFETKETIDIISESSNGWLKELNLISWNGDEPKYDIREWNSSHNRTGSGITLSKKELKKLIAILENMAL